MSRKLNNMKVNKEFVDKVNEIRSLINRSLKKRKLFGSYISTYAPFVRENMEDTYLSRSKGYRLSINGFEIVTMDNNPKSFSYLLKIAYIILTITSYGRKEKVTKNDILTYFCQDYLNEHKDNYRVKMNQIMFETIFGLVFLFIGMAALSFVIYHLIGYGFLLLCLNLICFVCFFGQLNLNKEKK